LGGTEEAAHECVSEEALVHLKSYKYSSVDKSLISNYILKHYVSKEGKGRDMREREREREIEGQVADGRC
jgi:hypothetical protein